jgi:hypothetical protein
MRYIVRQYRPAYFSGFEDVVCSGVSRDQITTAPWCEGFKRDGFTHFTVEPYEADELIISAHYSDGQHWVVGFALPDNSIAVAHDGGLLRDNWRYKKCHES